jgi:hypothetical protein
MSPRKGQWFVMYDEDNGSVISIFIAPLGRNLSNEDEIFIGTYCNIDAYCDVSPPVNGIEMVGSVAGE